ncbi:helix-turn-helix transcriptional regulator [Persicobacter psychrovividus]|uniref:Transcriptional regulator n=1 Tax=Persicobacter psychrovividus TaxID=387638 RepID=A0ABM7VHM2_9BACT|nr:transcriptional regulator [Persicobacter psychrovividus]
MISQLSVDELVESAGNSEKVSIAFLDTDPLIQKKTPIKHFDDFGILLVMEGSGSIGIDFETQNVEGNDLFLFGPGQVIRNVDIEGGKIAIIDISNDLLMNAWQELSNVFIMSAGMQTQKICLSIEETDAIINLFTKVTRETELARPYSEVMVNLYIMEVFVILERAIKRMPEIPSIHQSITNRFFSLFFLHSKKQRRVSFYADKLNITPNYLNIAIKKATGKNVKHFINQMILINAQRLLKFTDMDVKSISYELEFESPAYFNYFFKKEMGITPLEFRKQNTD